AWSFTLSLQARLPQNTVERPRCQIVARFSGYGNASRLARVLELAVATARRKGVPPVSMKQAQDLNDLHGLRGPTTPKPATRPLGCRLTNVRDFPVPKRHRGVRIELRHRSFRKGKSHERSFYAWNRLGKEYILSARR